MVTDFFKDNLIFIIYVLLVLCYVCIMLSLNRIGNNRVRRSYKILRQGFIDKTVLSKDDIRLIYKCSKISMPFVDYLEGFIFYLRDSVQEDKTNFNEINATISKIASEERQEKPFEDVEQYEKQLLKTIDEAVQNGEKQSVHNELRHLATSIKNSQKKIKQLTRTNMWSVPASIIGALITIIIWWFGRTSISKKDIETIKENTRTVVIETLDLEHSAQLQEH